MAKVSNARLPAADGREATKLPGETAEMGDVFMVGGGGTHSNRS
jgi:hypothetical protein